MAKSASKSAKKKSASVSVEADATANASAEPKNGAKASRAKPAATASAAPPVKSSEDIEPEGTIFVGQSVKPERILLRMANRHGLATGATGTGKTVTLQVLAEGFSRNGVPVFAADIKGDLSGISMMGEEKPFLIERAQSMGLDVSARRLPDDFLGPVRRRGPSDPRHRLRDGAASAGTAAQPE